MKRTLVFVSNKAPEEGAPHQLMPAIWLSRRGWPVLALCAGIPGGAEFRTPLGAVKAAFLRLEEGPWGRLRWQAALFFRLLGLRLRLGRKAAYYVHGSTACPAAWLALAGTGAARRLYHTQDFLEPSRHPAWAFFERRFALGAGTVICNEINRGRFMASHYRLPGMPLILPTALPKAWPLKRFQAGGRAALQRRLGLKGRGLRLVLHQGPFSRLRCSEAVLQALRLLPKNYALIFTGVERPWPQGMLDGLEGRVVSLPDLPYARLLELAALCDLGLLLYPNDGVGNFYQAPGRLTECLGSGLPVVASRFPGLELLFLRHGLGRLCDSTSPQDIAKAILSLGSLAPASRRALRLKLRRVFESELCFDRGASVLEGAARRLMEAA